MTCYDLQTLTLPECLGLFSDRQFKWPTSKPIKVEGGSSNFLVNFYGRSKKSTGGFNPANWRKPYRVLICLVPRPHYSARPIRFGSRGPCEVPPIRLGYVTEVNWPRRPGRTPYRDYASHSLQFVADTAKFFEIVSFFFLLDISKARTLIKNRNTLLWNFRS